MFILLKNSIVDNQKKIKYIIQKIQKYTQSGGNSELLTKIKDDIANTDNIGYMYTEIKKISTMMTDVDKELDDLKIKIDNAYKESKNINKMNYALDDIEKFKLQLGKFVSLGDIDSVHDDDLMKDIDFQNLGLIYHGLIKKTKHFLDIKNIIQFNEFVEKSLDETISELENFEKKISSYTEETKQTILEKEKFINGVFSINATEIKDQINQAKLTSGTTVKSFKKKILYVAKNVPLTAIQIKKLADFGKSILDTISISDKISTIKINDKKFTTQAGGNAKIIDKLNILILHIDKCNISMGNLRNNKIKDNRLSLRIANFEYFLISIVNYPTIIEDMEIYEYIDKKTIVYYLEIIKDVLDKIKIVNNDKKIIYLDQNYFVVLTILKNAFSIMIQHIDEKDIVETEKLNDAMKKIFILFNNFKDVLDSYNKIQG